MAYHKICLIVFVTIYILGCVHCQDVFFQQEIEDDSILPASGRLPLLNYTSCDENELLYPGDNDGDWICDCKRGYVYVPKKNKCYPVYDKGPCKNGHILVLRKESRLPRCRLNSCSVRGEIVYRKKCVKPGGLCNADSTRFYGVNETTLQFECLKPHFVMNSRFSNVEECIIGSRKHITKKCS